MIRNGYIEVLAYGLKMQFYITMDYVKYRMSNQNNWHEGTATVNQGTDHNLHVYNIDK